MYLKCIEINGFKSFANKIIFEFPHGITGIVGPNGSGKSNIGDAVRWVLGEQSAKQLRGSKMEDVIFSGTQNRKPMGFAYVSITFDNTDRKITLDYDEVKVARRVYRSGESEYLINGSVCRRRDIVEIFYDTGIGKDGYSIIGQGQVEKILSGKIEDSRELFDEAAGIAKYKKNRSVTEKTLDQERQNLERVTDILSELEKQVGPLEHQSKKAKEYLVLKEKEKDIDLHLFVYDHETITKEHNEVEKQHGIVMEDLDQTKKDYEKIIEKNTQIQEKSKELDEKAEHKSQEKEKWNGKKEETDNQILLLEHKMDSNNVLSEHFLGLVNQNKAAREEKELALSEQKKELAEKSSKLIALEEEYHDQEEELSVIREKREHIRAKMNAKKDNMFSLLHTTTDTKEKLSRYNAIEEQIQIRNAEYNSRLIGFRSELNDYNDNSVQLEKDIKLQQEKTQKARDHFNQILTKKNQCASRRVEYQKKLDDHNQNFLRARSRYETLVNITERYDGYNQSIKHIMEQKKHNPDIIGVVADILTLDKQYETAIEIALGGSLQNIVTENDAVAKKMIAFLKQNRFGRATFLPLTSIRKRGSMFSQMILEENGVIGIASSLVSYDPRFDNLVQSLLGRTIVVDTIDHALHLSRKNNFSIRIVTLDGELLNPGGAITGGAFRHSGNLLGRKREMDEYKKSMVESKEGYDNTKAGLEQLGEEEKAFQKKAQECQNHLNECQLRLHDLEHNIPALEEKKKDLIARIDSLKEEHLVLEEQLADIKTQKEQLSMDQESNQKIHDKNNDVIAALEEEQKEITQQVREKEAEKNNKLLALSSLRQEIEFLKTNGNRFEKEIRQCEKSVLQNEEERKKLENENAGYQAEIVTLEKEADQLKEKLFSIQNELDQLKLEQKNISSQHNTIFKELEDKNERLLVLEKEEGRLNTRIEKLKENLESRINYMWENYEVTYNYAVSVKKYDINPAEVSELRKERKTIQSQIKELGNVNVNAIEEYKNVGERYEFLRGQYDDIKESEANLMKMIDELNTAMRKQFAEQFGEIAHMFTEVFRNLFEGGTASLELMDEADILECGIRIVAQPPGKKLQNIMLLSGGERALTAIALLFAIQNLKPSPFCLLDEIEAALDDANIVRFAKYLRQLSSDTQFIVITHRRGTMNAADALYGITMQEKGISTLISVDLIDKDLN